VESKFVEDVRRAASSFSSSSKPVKSIFPLTKNSTNDDIQVTEENLLDVLLFLGILIDESRLSNIREENKHFLNVVGDNIFTLQVCLVHPS
jgi:hypothetical protein